MALDRLPGANALKEAPRPIGNRDRPQRPGARRGRRRWIDDGDGRAFLHRLLNRRGKRQSVRASAGDDDVEDGSGLGHCGTPPSSHCGTDHKSIPALGPPRHLRVRFHLFKALRHH